MLWQEKVVEKKVTLRAGFDPPHRTVLGLNKPTQTIPESLDFGYRIKSIADIVLVKVTGFKFTILHTL